MKKAVIIVFPIIFLFGLKSNAQDNSSESNSYVNAVGIKFYPGGITFKHFINTKNAVEGLGYFYNRGTRITALYEIHNDLPSLEGLRWYVGPGAHVGYFNHNYGGGIALGVDGVLGLDYKVSEAPINLSLDVQPTLDLGSYSGANRLSIWGGIGIRYTF